MGKRHRKIVARPGELVAAFGKDADSGDLAVQYAWGGHGAASSDARILCNALEENLVYKDKSLVQELEARGYDLATLKFSIHLKS